MQVRGFYGVLDLAETSDLIGRARALAEGLIAGGVAVLQVRMKRSSSRGVLEAAWLARQLTERAGVPLVVNDRLDVALAVGADGVHLGQEDLPLPAAHAALKAAGRKLVIGVSTHNLRQVHAAVAAGADYLGFGPVYATGTKQDPDPVQGIEGLRAAVAAAGSVPVVAIGGITPERAPEIARCGAAAACSIAAVNGAPDIAEAARRVARAFA